MFFFFHQAVVSEDLIATGMKEIIGSDGTGINLTFWKFSDFKNYKNDSKRCRPGISDKPVRYEIDVPWATRFKNSEDQQKARYFQTTSDKSSNSDVPINVTIEKCKSTIGNYICNNGDASTNYDLIAGHSRKYYPNCEEITSNFECVYWHPNFKYMTIVSNKQPPKTANDINRVFLDLRICESYAKQVYDKCKYAESIHDLPYKNRWTVDPGMSFDDFKKKLLIYDFDQTNDEEKDRPGYNCWDPTNDPKNY